MKKHISLFMVFIFLFNMAFSVSAATGYMPGPKTYAVTAGLPVSLTANEPTELSFYLPFDSESVTITYEGAIMAFTLTLASADGTETTEKLYKTNTEGTHTFSTVQRKGEFNLTLTASRAVTITGLTFNKAQVTRPANGYIFNQLKLSETDNMLLSTVVIDRDASAILVGGGKRYIDYNDAALTGDIINGKFYLPAHTLARALGYYIENYPARHYLLLRHDRVEYCFTDSLSYKEFYNGYDEPVREDIENPLLYKNGKAYLPVREFAESLGKTVGFRDGLVVIDDKYTVETILSDYDLFTYVKDMLEEFHPDADSAGTTYYVEQENPNASDDGDGTKAHPFKTLEQAALTAEAGDTVIIGSGTYRETLTPKNSGTATEPIIFQAAENADVVISALNEVSGFTAEDGGIYSAPLSWNLGKHRNQVFYNSSVLTEARYPNGTIESEILPVGDGEEPFDVSWPIKGDFRLQTNEQRIKTDEEGNYVTKKDEEGNVILDDDGNPTYEYEYVPAEYVTSGTLLNQTEADYWKGGSFLGMFGLCYWMQGGEILASENGKLRIEQQDNNSFDNGLIYASSRWGDWSWGYIVGHRNCMDIAGEWIIEDGKLSLIPPAGADVNNLTVEVKKRPLTVDLSGKDYIQIKGITTMGGSMLLKDSNMCVVNGCEILYNNHFLLDDDCNATLREAGENGIYVSGTGNAFVNNNIYEAAGAAIIGGGTYMYIENNDIKNCGYAGSTLGSLYFPSGDLEQLDNLRGGHGIYANTVARAGRSVLLQGGNTNAIYAYLPEEIAYNDFHDGIITALDAGITYDTFLCVGTEKIKGRYHNNYVYTTRPLSNPFSFGIYHDGSAEFIDTYNNIVFTTQSGVRITSGGSNPGDTSVYTQTAETSWADCDKWNNIALAGVTGGPTAITAKDYPDEKPFFAGADRGEDFLLNYNEIVGGAAHESDTVFAKDAALSDGASLTGNAAYLEPGESVTFTVNLGSTEVNSFLVGFLGDKYDEAASYTLTIGGNTYDVSLDARSATKEQLNIQAVLTKTVTNNVAAFQKYSGTQTVTLTCTGGGRVGIVSIKPRNW